jgi:hypothetical protein
MRGREFLNLAQELLAFGTAPRHWRAAVIHSYYALLLECRDTMASWGIPPPPRQQVHAQVRLRLVYATDPDVKHIGHRLEELVVRRNLANYDLRALPLFATAAAAQSDVNKATKTLALLDAIEGDPARRAAAIASIRP